MQPRRAVSDEDIAYLASSLENITSCIVSRARESSPEEYQRIISEMQIFTSKVLSPSPSDSNLSESLPLGLWVSSNAGDWRKPTGRVASPLVAPGPAVRGDAWERIARSRTPVSHGGVAYGLYGSLGGSAGHAMNTSFDSSAMHNDSSFVGTSMSASMRLDQYTPLGGI